MAHAEFVELALHCAVDTADARQVIARAARRRSPREGRSLGGLGRRRHRRRGRRKRCGLGKFRHRQPAIDAARVIGLAAGRKDLRLPQPILLLDAAFDAELVVEALDVCRSQRGNIGEAADAELTELLLETSFGIFDFLDFVEPFADLLLLIAES